MNYRTGLFSALQNWFFLVRGCIYLFIVLHNQLCGLFIVSVVPIHAINSHMNAWTKPN